MRVAGLRSSRKVSASQSSTTDVGFAPSCLGAVFKRPVVAGLPMVYLPHSEPGFSSLVCSFPPSLKAVSVQ